MQRRGNGRKRMALAWVLSLALCAAFLPFLLPYSQSMSGQVYSFSVLPEDGQEWDGPNGWNVFTDEAGTRTELIPDGAGGYTGLDYPGQTLYYSRVLTQSLTDPLLRIDAVNRTIAVFLDGALLYTDCPELDNRIGCLRLPMLDWDRDESVSVSLPRGYGGKMLTIAQSTPAAGRGEVQGRDDVVFPCDVELSCGFAYESGVVAQAVRAAYPAVALALAALGLLAIFLIQARRHSLDSGLFFFALFLLLLMLRSLYSPTFATRYFPIEVGEGFFSLGDTAEFLSVTALLLFLSTRMRGKRRGVMLGSAFLQAVCSLGGVLFQLLPSLPAPGSLHDVMRGLPVDVTALALAAAVALSVWERRDGSRFFTLFCKAALVLFGLAVLALAVAAALPASRVGVGELLFSLLLGKSYRLVWALQLLILAASLWAVLALFVSEQARRGAETAALRLKEQMARESYAEIQRQARETAMLRHDLKRHLGMVETLLADGQEEQAGAYLREVLEQTEAVRPVVATGNYMINVILGSRLAAATEAGVNVRILRVEAPQALPLSDADLSSLLLNALDNAIRAASDPALENPEIVIDLHTREHLFYFSCENSCVPARPGGEGEDGAPFRGYGLAIMERIAEKYGAVLETAPKEGRFLLTLVLPLENPGVQAEA